MRRILASLVTVVLAAAAQAPVQAQDKDVEELKKKVDGLEKKVKDLESTQQQSDLDKALKEVEDKKTPSSDIASTRIGGVGIRLVDVSFDVLFAAGISSEPDDVLETLQVGGHDPSKRGFSLTQAEISLAGAVDHYFTAESHIVFFINNEGETEVELEEAFLKTTELPWGLQVKAGHFLNEFGRINPVHPHAWRWIDQPIINGRLFGGDGLRSPGVRVSWLTPLPFASELYFEVQNARGETVGSFFGADGDPTTGNYLNVTHNVRSMGDMLYMLRWENGFDLSDEFSTQFGISGLAGPNSTGNRGSTYIYGMDAVVKWRPVNSQRGWPSVIFETEVMGRTFHIDEEAQIAQGLTVPTRSLHDWGLYTQVLWLFTTPWAVGIRYEYAIGNGNQLDTNDPATFTVINHSQDPLRDHRERLSPLLIWHASEFSRFRLQYNFDHADSIPNANHRDHAVWLSVEFLIGAHPAHKY